MAMIIFQKRLSLVAGADRGGVGRNASPADFEDVSRLGSDTVINLRRHFNVLNFQGDVLQSVAESANRNSSGISSNKTNVRIFHSHANAQSNVLAHRKVFFSKCANCAREKRNANAAFSIIRIVKRPRPANFNIRNVVVVQNRSHGLAVLGRLKVVNDRANDVVAVDEL